LADKMKKKKQDAELQAEKKKADSQLKAQKMKTQAQIKSQLAVQKYKAQAKSAQAKAKTDAAEAQIDAQVKLTVAKAKAKAAAADERQRKASLRQAQRVLRLKQEAATESAQKAKRTATEKANKNVELIKLRAQMQARTAKEANYKQNLRDKTPGAKRIQRLARRASRDARQVSRKETRQARRKARFARRKLEKMQRSASRAVRDQAHQAIDVLRKKAHQAGIRDLTEPAEMMRVGNKPDLSDRQRQAMRAAYAVGAARRAAKLAWMKVMRKMDFQTKRRERRAMSGNAATGVAATTAMQALVAAMKHSSEGDQESMLQSDADDGSLAQYRTIDDELRLPKPKTRKEDKAPVPAPAVKSVTPANSAVPGTMKAPQGYVDSDVDVPVEYGIQLPKMNNGKARKDAQKISDATVQAVQLQTRAAEKAVQEAEERLSRMKRRMQAVAKKRYQREVGLQEANVEFAEANLNKAKLRAESSEVLAQKEEMRELREAHQQATEALQIAKNQQKLVQEEGQEKISRVKADLHHVLNGGTSNSLEWDAHLYKPEVKVVSQEMYTQMQAENAAAQQKKKNAAEAAIILQVNQRTQREQLRAQKIAEEKALRAAKMQRMQAALAQLKASENVIDQVAASVPKNQGLSRYLNKPVSMQEALDVEGSH